MHHHHHHHHRHQHLKSILPTLWGWTVHFLNGCSSCCPVSWVNVGNIRRSSEYLNIWIFEYFICQNSYQARFCLRISYPAILFTMLMEFLNRGSFIVRALSAGNKQSVHIVSFPLLGARIHILLPGTRQYHIIHSCHIMPIFDILQNFCRLLNTYHELHTMNKSHMPMSWNWNWNWT